MIGLFLNLFSVCVCVCVRAFCDTQNLKLFPVKAEMKQNSFLVGERTLRDILPAFFLSCFDLIKYTEKKINKTEHFKCSIAVNSNCGKAWSRIEPGASLSSSSGENHLEAEITQLPRLCTPHTQHGTCPGGASARDLG